MILVLNKIDLIPSHIALAWKHYFEAKYKDIRVILFTSFPSYNLRSVAERDGAAGGLKILRRRGKMRMAKEGAYQIQQACKAIVKGELDITSWENKIIEEIKGMQLDELAASTSFEQQASQVDDTDFDMKERARFQNGILTVGCVVCVAPNIRLHTPLLRATSAWVDNSHISLFSFFIFGNVGLPKCW